VETIKRQTSCCLAVRLQTRVMTSRADHIRTQLQQASNSTHSLTGDIRATWGTAAQSLLHSRQKVIYDKSEGEDLVGMFSSFFVDKVRRIRDNIASALQQSSPRVFAARPHTGPASSIVTGFPAGDYWRGPEAAGVHIYHARHRHWTFCLSLYWRTARKSSHRPSPHSPTCHCNRKVPSTLQISAGAAATEEGGARQIVASQLQADI